MTIHDFYENFESLSYERQQKGIDKMLDYLKDNWYNHENIIFDMMAYLDEEESHDAFGTEGMNI